MRETNSVYEEKPLTVYLGESGTPHDTSRIDILPNEKVVSDRRISVSVSNRGITITDIENQITLMSVNFNDLPSK